ncbi:MAG: hypothetical protein CMN60_21100 [Sphingobium sp.]|nr:hypothetical protein [Sphingobium sp.]MBS50129.1 hypothetical protein [Sphingobium sp.]|tara:strand:- start:662 stop:1033 length:372 start_codon:yes stop_codon:yes gene_type:complete
MILDELFQDDLSAALRSMAENIAGEQTMTGYKVMAIENGKVVAGANNRIVLDIKKGDTMRMPGNGIYMSLDRDYVLDYYSGLAEEEILVTFEFNPNDIIFGNITDRETEFTVPSAKVIDIEYL